MKARLDSRPALLAALLGALLATLLGVGAPLTAWAYDTGCERPGPPEVPDGDTASDVQMIGTSQRIKLYQDEANKYLACLVAARDKVGTVGRDMKLKSIDKQYDGVIEEVTQVVESFNAALALYRARGQQDAADESDEASTPE